ncbi:hypothetical protein CL614_10410 [archaeon]|jgi:hypothetical protein|nr:hypothetical protein [archaeon]|tara:strand:+ start:2235 stop:2978 length:744 start_codon:yes stop_codon:yes gene_type:complete
MAVPTTRSEFSEYCLRKLGKPVIEINVTDEQVDDRVDESLLYYYDYHFDGTEKIFLKHVITANDVTNGYITVPENIIGVVNMFDATSSTSSTNNIFNLKYQFVLNEVFDMARYSLVNYYMTVQHIQLLEELLVGMKPIRYNRHRNQLHVDTNWDTFTIGNYLVAECYSIVDPATYTDAWNDRWLKNYCTAKIKYQWGSNLTKFNGMQLPGGVQFNGEQILADAREEIHKLEEEMIISYSLPVTDMIA